MTVLPDGGKGAALSYIKGFWYKGSRLFLPVG